MIEMSPVENRRGLTLIEIILTIAILGIAMLGIMSMLVFGTKMFSKNVTQSEVQSDTRYGMGFINSETKYASEMKILSAVPDNFAEKKRYIYVKDKKLMHKVPGSDVVEIVAPNDGSGYDLSIEFKKGSGSKGKLLGIKMSEKIKSQNFFLETENELINLEGEISEEDIKDKNLESGGVIEYSLLANSNRIVKFTFRKEDNGKISKEWTSDIEGSISGDTIRVWIPAKTSLKDLVASYVSTGIKVKVGETVQKSGETSNDFTPEIVSYKVIAEDGSERTYKVIVGNHSETPPDAANVRIFAPEGVGWNDVSLTGMYTYIANGNGKEGASEYRWFKGEKLDGKGNIENPKEITGASKEKIVPKEHGIKDGYLQFEVKPISETGAIGNWKSSKSIEIYESGNLLWRKIVGDLYYFYLEGAKKQEFDEDRKSQGLGSYEVAVKVRDEVINADKTFKMTTNIKDTRLNVEGTKHFDGVHFAIDLKDYVKDINGYSVIFDTKLARTGDYLTNGWGMSLNARLNSQNRDAGYMFQFDPGASGFVVRRNNFNHYVIPDMGVKRSNGSESGSGATYRPSRINNTNFGWSGNDGNGNDRWYRDYTTEIVVQRQLDGSLIKRVRIWETSKGPNYVAEEMWFGDFGDITYGSNNFLGQAVDEKTSVDKNKSLYQFSNSVGGTYLGLRSWSPSGKKFKADFINLEVGDGFSMDIKEARFLDKDRVEIEFSQPLRNSFIKDRVKLNGISVESIQEPNPNQNQKAIVNVSGVTDSMLSNGLGGNSVERGAFRHEKAGDVKINNGGSFTIRPQNSQ